VSILAILEWRGLINAIPVQEGSELIGIAPVFGAFGSIALTFGLLILYDRQAAILEQQYQPYLTGEIESRSAVTSQFVVRNTGEDYAYNIKAEWTIADETRVWETPSLAPGETAAFPVIVDEDGGWMLHTQQIKNYLDEEGISSEIDYQIRCEDQFGIPDQFSGSVDFDVMTKREDSFEIWETDPIDSIAASMASLEASVDQIASDIDDRRDEDEWQDRWTKQQAIINIVTERKKVPIEVLSRILSTREGSLEYRLSELEAAGYLRYDERQGMVKAEITPGDNHVLSDFS
jgi:hypothetical protein